jgi:hypothetical protein
VYSTLSGDRGWYCRRTNEEDMRLPDDVLIKSKKTFYHSTVASYLCVCRASEGATLFWWHPRRSFFAKSRIFLLLLLLLTTLTL